MELPLYQVDAFTDHVFGGNPAAICPLDSWLPNETLQAIAAENNLAETAYFIPKGNGYALRWFTPVVEMPLCGHATLASAHVIFTHLRPEATELRFESLSGELVVTREGKLLTLDFPARPASKVAPPAALIEGLGTQPLEVQKASYLLAAFANEEEVRSLQPDMRVLGGLDPVICTAPGSGEIDFVSRFFAPSHGIDEDPVTGSAHCTLVPYWSARLKKTSMRARQISKRVGDLWVELRGDRVRMSGYGVEYLRGTITIPD
jgi:PhzF family phenazine biosynthesis protein